MFFRRLAAIRTYTPVAFYKLLNNIHQPTFLAELTIILDQAKRMLETEDLDKEWDEVLIPEMAVRVSMPRIPGLNTSMFEG